MKKIYTFFTLGFLLASFDAFANHCGGGHKEIKDTSDTTTEEEDKTTSN